MRVTVKGRPWNTMPFPVTERVVYAQNPVREVICQLRFPDILEIGTSEPAGFQKEVKKGYPFYERDDPGASIPSELLGMLDRLPESPFPKPGERVTHKFLSEDRGRYIALARQFFAVSESAYSDWATFRGEIDLAKEVTERTYEPNFYTRVGLRYVDAIDREGLGLAGEPWRNLLNEAILGPIGDRDVGGEVQIQRSEITFGFNEVAGGVVKIRCGLSRAEASGEVFLIDSDFYTEEKTFGNQVLAILDAFHRDAGNLFRWAIKPRLALALGTAT